ncbi:hypothetical protein EYF80_034849 [Liparis tanakae]|uniref:Uncharacterized protein n=1 Tax=Liparis tanakae TaxID=230148 RepID=A0A4Z2GQ35_9TELE|nr:hypothetical protein EYF80_034849 [Liparis tanakae]
MAVLSAEVLRWHARIEELEEELEAERAIRAKVWSTTWRHSTTSALCLRETKSRGAFRLQLWASSTFWPALHGAV